MRSEEVLAGDVTERLTVVDSEKEINDEISTKIHKKIKTNKISLHAGSANEAVDLKVQKRASLPEKRREEDQLPLRRGTPNRKRWV